MQTPNLGKPWQIKNGHVEMDGSDSAKQFVAAEAEFAYGYYKNIAQLLNTVDPTGGVIIDDAGWTMIMGQFKSEFGKLADARGEMIDVITPDFDYCLSQLTKP